MMRLLTSWEPDTATPAGGMQGCNDPQSRSECPDSLYTHSYTRGTLPILFAATAMLQGGLPRLGSWVVAILALISASAHGTACNCIPGAEQLPELTPSVPKYLRFSAAQGNDEVVAAVVNPVSVVNRH
jgi:hypothetical protein